MLDNDVKLVDLPLPTRVAKALAMENLVTVGDVREKSDYELTRIPNFGRSSLKEAYRFGLRTKPSEIVSIIASVESKLSIINKEINDIRNLLELLRISALDGDDNAGRSR